MRALVLGIITLLAACPLNKTATLGGGTTPSSSSMEPSPSKSADSGGEEKRWFGPEDFKALEGLTVEQARAKAKALGHTGQIDVSEAREFIAGCKDGTVCEAEAGRGGDTMGFADGMILTINRTITIAPPSE